jgi:seryl-tRNA synthetase
MDIEKLIERLKHDYHGYSTVENNPEETFHDMVECLTALSTLQAENEQLRAELEQAGAEIARLKHYEDKCHDCPIVCAKTEIIKAHEELEAIQAELEQVKWEKDAAVNDLQCIKSCAVCKHCDSLQTPIPEICKKCSHGENWDWRGPKED